MLSLSADWISNSYKEHLQHKYDVSEAIEKLLANNGIYSSCEPCDYGVRISISWGDWKHEHLRAKLIIEEAGYDYSGSVITEEDGDDCYSADHYVLVA